MTWQQDHAAAAIIVAVDVDVVGSVLTSSSLHLHSLLNVNTLLLSLSREDTPKQSSSQDVTLERESLCINEERSVVSKMSHIRPQQNIGPYFLAVPRWHYPCLFAKVRIQPGHPSKE